MNDPQLELYRTATPARYARVADLVDLAMALSEQAYQRANRRSGGMGCDCDDGRPCREHRAAHRLLRLYEHRPPDAKNQVL